jgi:hypothetical protein
LAVGRVQVITALKEMLGLASGISGAYESAVETASCDSLYGSSRLASASRGLWKLD